jgi:hypothetical protein
VSKELQLCARVTGTVMALCLGAAAWAATPKIQPSPPTPVNWNAECVGYYTVGVPGDLLHATSDPQSLPLRGGDGNLGGTLGARQGLYLRSNAEDEVNTIGRDRALVISQPATMADLQARLAQLNAQLAGEKKLLLELADDIESDKSYSGESSYRVAAAKIQFYQSASNGAAFYFLSIPKYPPPGFIPHKLTLVALVGDRMVSAHRAIDGTPQQTIDNFLKNYKPRKTFEIPTEPGVCVPYGFVTGEKEPADIGMSWRLLERPDIVVYLRATDASSNSPEDPKEYLRAKGGIHAFVNSVMVKTLDGPLFPFHKVEIDGHRGLGAYTLVLRGAQDGYETNNPATKNEDWGYIAYVPGIAGAKPGESFNLMFKVERFGRFAKKPMSEKEFRTLVKRIEASIRRRPGAWVVQ